jgi:hypothetical protein
MVKSLYIYISDYDIILNLLDKFYIFHVEDYIIWTIDIIILSGIFFNGWKSW